jgi:hypothetical protein
MKQDNTTTPTTQALVWRKTSKLRPHPTYASLRGPLLPEDLARMKQAAEEILKEPLKVTSNGIILDGYARWQLARKLDVQTLPCYECHPRDEVEVLKMLLDKHLHRGRALNAYCRIVLALEMEPALRERARANQRRGPGKNLLSDLTTAQKQRVRDQLSRLSGASAGNVTKVRRLQEYACPEVLQALREGSVTIHRAYGWRDLAHDQQQSALREFHDGKDVGQQITTMLRKHKPGQQKSMTKDQLIAIVEKPRSRGEEIQISVLKGGKRTVFVSDDLLPAGQRDFFLTGGGR